MTAPFGAALIFMLGVMILDWLTVRATGNGGWTDVFWTFGTGLAGVGVALWPVESVHSTLRQGLVAGLMRQTYGADAKLWTRRWRRFFLATAALFGDAGGEAWAVSHYRLKSA